MAKKQQDSTTPEVSSLPIKQDESPLVIDLPDGQKLVVGHLANGSVIEVATWRGTGRPDSRTSRLMLGMSSAEGAAQQAAAESAAKGDHKKSSPIAPAIEVIAKISKQLSSFKLPKKTAKPAKPVQEEATTPSTPFIQTVAPAPVASASDDVQEWLDSIIAKTEKKVSKSVEPVKKTTAKKTAPKSTVRKAAPKSAARRSR